MNKLMSAIIAATAIAAAGAPALAADLRAPVYKSAPPPAPVFSWTGCYLGGNIGGASAYKSFSDPLGTYPPAVPGQDLGYHNAAGFVGGGQVGCDYQFGSWVIGAQGMFNWTSQVSGENLQFNGAFANQTSIPWVTTATARLGYTGTPTLLIYVKGGGAWVRDDYSSVAFNGTQFSSATVTRSGWTVALASSRPLRAAGRGSPSTIT